MSDILTVAGIGWYFLMKLCKSKKWLKFNIDGEVGAVENDQDRAVGHL